jgi:2'-5' RNA ligase
MSNPTQIILPPTSEYLLVLSPDEDLQERIGRIKQVFAEKTGARISGRKTHILLARWQGWDMQEEKLMQRLSVVAMEQYPFRIQLDGFAGFPSHTWYVQVPTREPIVRLVANLRKHKRWMQSGETDPYFIHEPHLPIARGLTPGQYEQALQQFGPKHFHAGFLSDGMLLLKKRPGAQAYQILKRFDFEHMPVLARQASLF